MHLFEAVLLRMRRQSLAIDNEEQQKWPKMRRQHANSTARAPNGKSGFKQSAPICSKPVSTVAANKGSKRMVKPLASYLHCTCRLALKEAHIGGNFG